MPITDHFVTFSAAKDMRALGFNDPCMAHYGIIPHEVPNIQKYLHPYPLTEQTEHNVLAPTYEQAFAWLRDKDRMHRITHIVQPIDNWDSWTYKILMEGFMCPFDECRPEDALQWETYEQCREACLNHILEILKPKTSDKK